MGGEKLDLTGIDPIVLDRFKFDHEDDEDDEQLAMHVDSYDPFNMRYRAHLFDRSQAQVQAARRLQTESAGQPNALVPAGSGQASHQPAGS